MTTLAEVSNRVDAMNQNCFDKLVDVPAISFDSLQTMKIGDERTHFENHGPEVDCLATRNPLQLSCTNARRSCKPSR